MVTKLLPVSGELKTPRPRFVAFGRFFYDLNLLRLTHFGKRLRIDQKTAELLALFIENPCRLVTRAEIHGRLWSDSLWDADASETVTRLVASLRISLGDILLLPAYIETIGQEGYAFVADLKAVDSPQQLCARCGRRMRGKRKAYRKQ